MSDMLTGLIGLGIGLYLGKEILSQKQNHKIMAEELKDIKDQLVTTNAKVDEITTAVGAIPADIDAIATDFADVKQDQAFLLAKINSLPASGPSPAEIEEVKTLAGGLSAKVNALADSIVSVKGKTDALKSASADLADDVDSSEQQPGEGEGGTPSTDLPIQG